MGKTSRYKKLLLIFCRLQSCNQPITQTRTQRERGVGGSRGGDRGGGAGVGRGNRRSLSVSLLYILYVQLLPRRKIVYYNGLPWVLASALAGGWLNPGALAIWEEAAAAALEIPAGFTQMDRRAYGETQVVFLKLD